MTEEEQNDQGILTTKILDSPLMILAQLENMNDEKQIMKILLPSSEYSEQLCLTKVWVIGNLTWTGVAWMELDGSGFPYGSSINLYIIY